MIGGKGCASSSFVYSLLHVAFPVTTTARRTRLRPVDLPLKMADQRKPSRISLRPVDSDPHGLYNSRSSSSSGFRAADPDSNDPIEKIRVYSSKVEDFIEMYSQPLKPHLASIGRFLIVVTFLEDAWRMMIQWSDQLWYLERCACHLFECG